MMKPAVTFQHGELIPLQFHNDLKEFIRLSTEKLGANLISIILFGGIAKKRYSEWSDFDFCLVVHRLDEQARLEIMNAFSKNCDIVLRRQEDLTHYLENLSAIDLEIFNTGIVIYGEDVLSEFQAHFELVKAEHQLIHHAELGKGVWEIGATS